MFCKFPPPDKKTGNASGIEKMTEYLSKEDKDRDKDHELSGMFSSEEKNLSQEQAKEIVEHSGYRKGLGANDAKYYTVVMSFSQKELVGKTNQELIEFAQRNFAELYVGGVVGRELDPKTIAWVGKLEENRYYKGDDPEVKDGKAKSGQLKSGDNRHLHIIVARKTLDGKQISPHSNHFREGKSRGAVKSGYDQDVFKIDAETRFDKDFGYKRSKEESVAFKISPYRKDILGKRQIDSEKRLETLLEKSDRLFSSDQQKRFMRATLKRNLYKAGDIKALERILSEKGVRMNLVQNVAAEITNLEFTSNNVSNPKTFTLKDLDLKLSDVNHLIEREKERLDSTQEQSAYDRGFMIDGTPMGEEEENPVKLPRKKRRKPGSSQDQDQSINN